MALPETLDNFNVPVPVTAVYTDVLLVIRLIVPFATHEVPFATSTMPPERMLMRPVSSVPPVMEMAFVGAFVRVLSW